MNEPLLLKGIDFTSPVTIRIIAKGTVEKRYSEYMSGMDITHDISSDHIPYTSLEGEVPDLAALIGVLNTLYDMHFPLISVRVSGKSSQ